jgi:hypothetical protein
MREVMIFAVVGLLAGIIVWPACSFIFSITDRSPLRRLVDPLVHVAFSYERLTIPPLASNRPRC